MKDDCNLLKKNRKYLPLSYFEDRNFSIPSYKVRNYTEDRPRYGLEVSQNSLEFTKEYTVKLLTYKNIGYDYIDNINIVITGPFEFENINDTQLDPNEIQQIMIKYNPSGSVIQEGSIYLNSLNTEGNTFCKLIGYPQ